MLLPIMNLNASIKINMFEEISFQNNLKIPPNIWLLFNWLNILKYTVKYFIKMLPKAFGGATIISMKMLEKTFD